MADFEQLKAWLDAWYERGDERSFRAFYRQFLAGAAARAARLAGLDSDAAAEAAQSLCMLFQNRTKCPGAKARTKRYWRYFLHRRAQDFARRVNNRQHRERLGGEPDAADDVSTALRNATELGAPDESDVIASLDRPENRARLQSALVRLAVDRRLYLCAFYCLTEALSESDLDRLEARSGRDRGGVLELLDLADGKNAEPLLPLFFSPADLEGAGRAQKLDTFRKGRRRAYLDLLRHLGLEE